MVNILIKNNSYMRFKMGYKIWQHNFDKNETLNEILARRACEIKHALFFRWGRYWQWDISRNWCDAGKHSKVFVEKWRKK